MKPFQLYHLQWYARTSQSFGKMPYNRTRPEARAKATEHEAATSAAARSFYTDSQSNAYTTQANAAIQRDLTRHALQLLQLPTEHEECKLHLLLDVGAGSGLSTRAAGDWFRTHRMPVFVMAFDISASMLSLAERSIQQDDKATHAVSTVAGFYRGNAAQKFPLRGSGVFDAAIGISMLQWLTKDGLKICFTCLYEQLAPDSGRAVFQVYPQTLDVVCAMEDAAMAAGFAHAEVFVSFPHATTAKKWFLRVHNSEQMKELHLCQFGRRFHRRCAWHYASADDEMRDRIGREHVKLAWHTWRKYRRARTCSSSNGSNAAAVHANAKKSLALWTSDQLFGEAFENAFVSPVRSMDDITYAFLLSHMDQVVVIMHSVRHSGLDCCW